MGVFRLQVIFLSILGSVLSMESHYSSFFMVSEAFISMKRLKAKTFIECAAICSANFNIMACTAFRFNVSGDMMCDMGNGNLYDTGLMVDTGSVSTYLRMDNCAYNFMKTLDGTKTCFRSNSGFWADDIEVLNDVPNEQTCQQHCQSDPRCSHFVYINDDAKRADNEIPRKCKLKTGSPQIVSVPDSRIAGLRCC